jgi:UDP-N-acetyl-D-glucosamine dehydrogenase
MFEAFETDKVGIIGLGYVGLPLALRFAEVGCDVLGVDLDARKIEAISRGESFLQHIPDGRVEGVRRIGRFEATSDFARLREVNAIIICVPTPLTAAREPDLSFIERAGREIAPHLHKGQLVSLESTTYPGTTRDVLRPLLEAGSGLKAGEQFSLVFSPEREDPGNARFSTSSIPKVVGGLTHRCLEHGIALYRRAVDRVVPVSTLEAAETTKLLENIFRAVNIALVNELKVLCHRFSDAGRPIDVHEVIDAASTKPFGFMPFQPGPGLGGHCIPIDPFYLTWKAREVEFNTRFIELAGEINSAMPDYVVGRVLRALSDRGKALKGAEILVLGVAYKADVDDMRESPSLKLIQLLQRRGAKVSYHDPQVAECELNHGSGQRMRGVALDAERIEKADALIIATAHQGVDYALIGRHAQLVIDTRNAMRSVRIPADRLVAA